LPRIPRNASNCSSDIWTCCFQLFKANARHFATREIPKIRATHRRSRGPGNSTKSIPKSESPSKPKCQLAINPHLNQGLELVGSATNFNEYVENTYKPLLMPLMAKTTQDRSRGVMANYLVPEFGKFSLRDLTPLKLQRYFFWARSIALGI
jgi:hypothetical protein